MQLIKSCNCSLVGGLVVGIVLVVCFFGVGDRFSARRKEILSFDFTRYPHYGSGENERIFHYYKNFMFIKPLW